MDAVMDTSLSGKDETVLEILHCIRQWLQEPEKMPERFLLDLGRAIGSRTIEARLPAFGLPWWQVAVSPGETPGPATAVVPFPAGEKTWQWVPHEGGANHWLLEVHVAGLPTDGLLRFVFEEKRPLPKGLPESLGMAGQALMNRILDPKDTTLSRRRRIARHNALLAETARLSAKLAHDFGNLMTGILGFAELALGQTPEGSLAASHVREIHHSAQEGAEWVRHLQMFSRRAWNQVPGFSLVHPLRDLRLPETKGRRTVLQVSSANGLPLVRIDSDSFSWLLEHLLRNACEAMAEGGTLTVSARAVRLDADDCAELLAAPAPGDFVEIAVADTGPGLDPEVARRFLEEPFVSSKKRHRGLGLPVCYGILRAFGGGLRLDPGPNGGLVARAYLPVFAEKNETGSR